MPSGAQHRPHITGPVLGFAVALCIGAAPPGSANPFAGARAESGPPQAAMAPPSPSLPTAAPIPASDPAATATTQGLPLFPGQVVQPIDLASALSLGGARDLDIATARQRVLQALADLSEARALWLPSLFLGPTWYRADGKIQTITGEVRTIDRSSLFVGGTAAMANGFPAPAPGTGPPQLNGLSTVLRISDAIYEPMAARRVAAASQAGVRTATNNALLAVSEAYFDLQQAAGTLAIAREATANAEVLSGLTGTFARNGQGLEADHRRALAELRTRRRTIAASVGRFKVASANLVRPLVLDPHIVVAPVEPAESVLRLVRDDACLDDLIVQAWQFRPELAQAQELVQAALIRWKQARLRPFIPSVGLTYAGGGFGGGRNGFFGDFGGRGDAAASLFWELRNLGFTDRAIARRRAAESADANIDLVRVQAQVAADVVASREAQVAALAQMDEARQSVTEAVESLELNLANIRRGAGLPGATRPIEVLQPIQALAQARTDYLDAVLTYNRSQFRLFRAIGQPPLLPPPSAPPPATAEAASRPPGETR